MILKLLVVLANLAYAQLPMLYTNQLKMFVVNVEHAALLKSIELIEKRTADSERRGRELKRTTEEINRVSDELLRPYGFPPISAPSKPAVPPA